MHTRSPRWMHLFCTTNKYWLKKEKQTNRKPLSSDDSVRRAPDSYGSWFIRHWISWALILGSRPSCLGELNIYCVSHPTYVNCDSSWKWYIWIIPTLAFLILSLYICDHIQVFSIIKIKTGSFGLTSMRYAPVSSFSLELLLIYFVVLSFHFLCSPQSAGFHSCLPCSFRGDAVSRS